MNGLSATDAAQDLQDQFLDLVQRNPANVRIIESLPGLGLANCHLVAGCLFQTVWNCLCGKSPGQDIADYDLFYHDAADLSWEAEDRAIRHANALFSDLGVRVEVRNQARVHLWYESKFGVPCAPLRSTQDGIDHFLAKACCVGISHERGAKQIYAPFGLSDLFSMVVRPNPRRDLPEVYYRKAKRWTEAWPRLRINPWPGTPLE